MAEDESRLQVTTYLLERFGIPPGVLDPYHLLERKRSWFILRKSEQIKRGAHLKVSKVGLRAFRKVGQFIKPTTRFIQMFGQYATKGVCQLKVPQLKTLVLEGEISVDLHLDKGYVILTLENDVALGLGFYDGGRLRSQLPGKQIREEMLK